jgi:hypothetical protein
VNEIDVVAPAVLRDREQIDDPQEPDSRANSGVISGKPIGLTESTSISPSSMR